MLAASMLAASMLAASVQAQDVGPQACGQQARSADYGSVRLGVPVVPQRHRYVRGDANWDARMRYFLGRPARVTRLSGVDARGCPGVRLDVDGGRWFWRIRDLSIGHAPPRASDGERGPASTLPQSCGGRPDFGPLRPDMAVVLGRHRITSGDDAWSESMQPFVGRVARIVALAGADAQGCAVVYVDVDSGEHAWRVRDLRLELESNVAFGYVPGLEADHGRPAASALAAAGGALPQLCSTEGEPNYGDVRVGTSVVLGRHRAVEGADNWTEDMEPFVGRSARVTELAGADEQGCPVVRVDVDAGEFSWRLRDLQPSR